MFNGNSVIIIIVIQFSFRQRFKKLLQTFYYSDSYINIYYYKELFFLYTDYFIYAK